MRLGEDVADDDVDVLVPCIEDAEIEVEVKGELELEVLMLIEVDELLRTTALLLLLVVLLDIGPLASRYQFAGGSPRHSPTVTGE
jgi:hypothetical protein